jgi:hypothetical protein
MQVPIVFGMSLSGGLKNILCSRYNMLPATYCAAAVYCRQWWKPMHQLANNNKAAMNRGRTDICSWTVPSCNWFWIGAMYVRYASLWKCQGGRFSRDVPPIYPLGQVLTRSICFAVNHSPRLGALKTLENGA